MSGHINFNADERNTKTNLKLWNDIGDTIPVEIDLDIRENIVRINNAKIEFDSSSCVDLPTWTKKINEDNRNKNVAWASNKKCFISESPVWKILLEVFLQVFMRFIWAVVIKIGIKEMFNHFDWFENKISAKAWSAVTVVSGIIVTYASLKLTNKINFLFCLLYTSQSPRDQRGSGVAGYW